jgi:hypothetical protein
MLLLIGIRQLHTITKEEYLRTVNKVYKISIIIAHY